MKKLTTAILMIVSILTLLMSPAGAQDGARIHLLHGIPDVDVDVEAGGANVIEGFSFGETEDLSALAGETLAGLKVKAAGTDTVAIDAGDVALPASGNYTVIADLDADGAPTLSVFENDVSTISAGNGRLIVRHAAAAPNVDILANGDVAFGDVPNGAEGKVDLATGTIEASVVPAGASEPVVIGPADLPINDGDALLVYAVGSLEDETLTVLTETISGLGSAPAAINTGNSPIDGDSGTSTLLLGAGLALLLGLSLSARKVLAHR